MKFLKKQRGASSNSSKLPNIINDRFRAVSHNIKRHKTVLISACAVIIVLTVAFLAGGNIDNSTLTERNSASTSVSENTINSTAVNKTESTTQPATNADSTQNSQGEEGTKSSSSIQDKSTAPQKKTSENRTEKDKYNTDKVPQGKPEPVEPQEQETIDNRLYCTFSISCATILDNMDILDNDKLELIPNDGWILNPVKIEFNEGESVNDVLQRVCRDNKIHLEVSQTPMYNSVYIEGINNIYEFDCGENSGWKYCVNDWFPNYGCSRYQLKSEDTVSFLYTCDDGKDIGADIK